MSRNLLSMQTFLSMEVKFLDSNNKQIEMYHPTADFKQTSMFAYNSVYLFLELLPASPMTFIDLPLNNRGLFRSDISFKQK